MVFWRDTMREDVAPDRAKARALSKMAHLTRDRLSEIPLEKYPSNTVVDLYDVIHKLIDAICLAQGIRFRGDGAHIELIEECQSLGVVTLAQYDLIKRMRTYRNRIQYEGFNISPEFVTRNEKRILSIIKKLEEHLEGIV